MKIKAIIQGLACSSMLLLMSPLALAQYGFEEDFEDALATGANGWIAQFGNGGGAYNEGDIGGSLGMDYSTPSDVDIESNGNYYNFYARYDDPGILQTSNFRNMGGFDGSDPYSANNGDYRFQACVYIRDVADFGADFENGVDAGIGVRVSGVSYSQWPGDLNFTASQSVSDVARNAWTLVSVDLTINDGSRVDAGVWVTNPAMPPTLNTGVFWDDLWFGLASDAPATECGPAELEPEPEPEPEPEEPEVEATPVPALPLWGLLGLLGLIGLIGSRSRR